MSSQCHARCESSMEATHSAPAGMCTTTTVRHALQCGELLQVEKAGGHSSCDGKGVSGLDVEITKHDQVCM